MTELPVPVFHIKPALPHRPAVGRLAVGRLSAALLIAGAMLFGCHSEALAQNDKLNLSHYKLTFNENFSKLDVSPTGPDTRWMAHTPWNGDFGDAVFDNPGPDGPFKVTPHGLDIVAQQDAKGKWHSGLLCSKNAKGVGPHGFAQQYGYFEMRAKLPSGHGVWPAFWLVSVSNKEPAPELDVMEFYGAFPTSYRTTEHLWSHNRDTLNRYFVMTVHRDILAQQYNDFGILIEPQTTTYFFNRQAYWSTPTLPEFRQPMAILVNLALGGGWPIKSLTSPQVMQIQYIRAYQAR